MLNSIYKAVGTTTIAGILLASAAAPPLYAQATTITPGTQTQVADEWKQLEPGASYTIEIHYDAHEKNGQIVSETLVELEMGKQNSVAFDVYTAAQYEKFVAGDDVTPVGRGNLKSAQTGNSYHDTKLLWANRTSVSETFHIRVKNRSAGTSSFHLDVSGKGTTIQNAPALALASAVTAEPVATQSVARSAVASTKAVLADSVVADGPGSAIAAGSNAGTLAAGETRWYTFKYDYDHSSDAAPKQATVQVKMNDKDSVAFEVWTPKQVREWTRGDKVNQLGAGSVFEDVDTTLIWVGSAKATDRYYVLVENLTDAPADYSIEISGSTVSF